MLRASSSDFDLHVYFCYVFPLIGSFKMTDEMTNRLLADLGL